MLSSYYNPIWQYIDVRKVREAMISEWSKASSHTSSRLITARLIKVLLRRQNLYDHLHNWRNKVLQIEPSFDPEESDSDTIPYMPL